MAIYELKHLHNTSFSQFPRDKTLLVMAISPMEPHGPHFPLGSDLMQAEGLIDMMVKKFQRTHKDWHIVKLPSLPIGADVLPAPGCTLVSDELMEKMVYGYLENFAYHGFRHLFAMGFHGGLRHNIAIEGAMDKIHQKYGVRYTYGLGHVGRELFVAGKIAEMLVQHGGLTELQASRDAHGGAMETSLGLYLYPEAMNGEHKNLPDIHMTQFAPLGENGPDVVKTIQEKVNFMVGHLVGTINGYFGWKKIAKEAPGYVGSPSLGTRELGAKLAKLISDTMHDTLLEEMAKPPSTPPNDTSAYAQAKAIGPGSIVSKIFGTLRVERSMIQDAPTEGWTPPPPHDKKKTAASSAKRPAEKTARVKSA